MTRSLIVLLLAAAALSCAAGVLFAPPRLPTSGWADTEVSTNLVFDAGAAEDNKFTLTISMENAATNNCVEVAFGMDADGDGTLAPEEAELAVSWDCGAWRLRDFRGGTVLQGDGAEATLTLAIDLAGASRLARSMEGNVFAGRAAPTFFNPAWNRAWVTVRGETAAQERIEARATPAGFIVRFR